MALGPMDWLVVEAPLVGFINTINMMVNEIWFKYSWYYKIYDGLPPTINSIYYIMVNINMVIIWLMMVNNHLVGGIPPRIAKLLRL